MAFMGVFSPAKTLPGVGNAAVSMDGVVRSVDAQLLTIFGYKKADQAWHLHSALATAPPGASLPRERRRSAAPGR